MEGIGLENTPQYDPYEDVTQNEQTFQQLAEELEPMPEVGYHYIGAKILLPRGDEMARGHVVAHSGNANGNAMDRVHTNLILDTRKYQVVFARGKVTELITNIIAESMYAQHDADGNEYLLSYLLVDYHKDDKAISLLDQQTTVRGRSVTCMTTASWQICCQWKDGSASWEKLFKLKESHLMQIAEFAVFQGIDHKPAFNRWVKHVLKKRGRKIASIRK